MISKKIKTNEFCNMYNHASNNLSYDLNFEKYNKIKIKINYSHELEFRFFPLQTETQENYPRKVHDKEIIFISINFC